jgi:hypothetical protein
MYENYLKQKQIEWKETVKEKKTKWNKKVIFSPGWLYQRWLEVVALGLGLELPLVPVGISNWD